MSFWRGKQQENLFWTFFDTRTSSAIVVHWLYIALRTTSMGNAFLSIPFNTLCRSLFLFEFEAKMSFWRGKQQENCFWTFFGTRPTADIDVHWLHISIRTSSMGNALLSMPSNTFLDHFFYLNLRQKWVFEGGNNRKIAFGLSLAPHQRQILIYIDYILP